MKRHVPFIAASIWSLPLVVGLALYCVAFLLAMLSVPVPNMLGMAVINMVAFLTLWPPALYPGLALIGTLIVVAWYQPAKTRAEMVLLGLYTLALVIYTASIVWAHLTGSHLDL